MYVDVVRSVRKGVNGVHYKQGGGVDVAWGALWDVGMGVCVCVRYEEAFSIVRVTLKDNFHARISTRHVLIFCRNARTRAGFRRMHYLMRTHNPN